MKIIAKLFVAVLVFFGATFGIYWFNLDTKLVAAISPILTEHYDTMERDRRL